MLTTSQKDASVSAWTRNARDLRGHNLCGFLAVSYKGARGPIFITIETSYTVIFSIILDKGKSLEEVSYDTKSILDQQITIVFQCIATCSITVHLFYCLP